MAKKQKSNPNTIAQNKRARFDFHITDNIEAGVSLMGWEVKSIRSGKAQLTDSYVWFKNGEAFLLNVQIQPLNTASTHFVTEPTRPRKLLLKRKEIAKLQRAAEQQGYTVVALSLYWNDHLVKCEIALGKGKQQHDKRETEKQRDWDRQKQRIFRQN
jgi:SsrA-binding protein